jgi:hypothetical protein
MTEDEMRKVAPSIFATAAHDSRSDRFQPIATIDILRKLQAEGFMPVGARQSRTRDPGKAPFTKHLIRLRRIDDGKTYHVGDTVCEILLKNANDGTSAYDLMAGLFRIACLNSLVAQTGTIDSVKVRHSGDVEAKVIEGTYSVLGQAEKTLVAPQDWSKIKLNSAEQLAFAESAHIIRFGGGEDVETTTPIQPKQLLMPRRYQDRGNDLWTVFNIVQEWTVRGGLRGVQQFDETGRRIRRVRTRAVTGIDQDIKLNKALWLLTQTMAELKGTKAAA